ncbi:MULTISPECIES: PHP domain-containing protein [unclassified Leptolyngbya]|uniref:PHP domain-containing protein n=1 Tax=unclassified Leptolyngbya TaxID=2650499 RepID=UPI001688DA5A|nr:PHP domain-containing protein [Leptolyngbya sp. FACHB-16]MBD1912383.1 PHP domain-containing protein [Leptolyngbya sp. FACHB-8]MBD2157981.1 PHP domain-containing protein [Leptolyngbya sp. FACHB-16]
MLELHCHTTFSDGTLTPTELVKEAIASGVKALAITDHDTLSGWPEAYEAASDHDLEIVPGLELSTVWGNRSLHILGFYPDPEKLEGPLGDRLNGRKRRAQAMIDKLAQLGYPVTLPEMGEGMAPGRPHVAKALVGAGHVKSYEEAFDRFLADGKAAYVQYEKFSAIDGVKLLRECGAVPVWAHPYLFRGGDVAQVLGDLMDAGLMGLEVYHPTHSPGQSAVLKDWCNQYGLVKTGGSDYHGPNTGSNHAPHLNSFHLPLQLLDDLKEAAASLKN